jgi:TolB-like protein
MASLIPGYEYDIFISYRLKDNKHDGWVTEFVANLKGELESTFKEEISVYFDINPHDGLLETHDVDASLKEKLKCLVFIPVISRTYCDPKSFAWEHEFKAFIEQASNDRFGLKVKLPNGNVANRVLPVRIHDLDDEDVKLFEGVIGGVMRTLDFVFKTASGVNRPLRSKEDHPGDNLDKTYYQDQVNKVALAIKEIIQGTKEEPVPLLKEKTLHREPLEEVKKEERMEEQGKQAVLTRRKLLLSSAIILAVSIAIVLAYPKLFNRDKFKYLKDPDGRISIAVIPFENWSQSEDFEHLGEAMANEISTALTNIEEFNIKSFTSTSRYKGSDKPSISQIGRELGAKCIIEGSVERQDQDVSIHVQLILASKNDHLWAEEFKGQWKDIFTIRDDITRKIAAKLEAVLTPKEKELVEKRETKNAEAYNLYLQGRFFWNKRTEEGLKKSVEYFEKSVEEDPGYALAYAGLADAYYISTLYGWLPKPEGYNRAKKFALRALEIDQNLAEAYATLGTILYWSEWKWEEARKEIVHAIALNPNYANAYMVYSELLDILGETDEAIIQINRAIELDPLVSMFYVAEAIFLYNTGKFEESLNAYLKVEELNSDYVYAFWGCFYIYVMQDKGLNAVEELQKIMRMDTSTIKYTKVIIEIYNKSGAKGLLNWVIELQLNSPKPSPSLLTRCYAILDKKEEALDWLEKELEDRPTDLPRINTNPDFNNLRSEPRFLALLEKMGLSEYH